MMPPVQDNSFPALLKNQLRSVSDQLTESEYKKIRHTINMFKRNDETGFCRFFDELYTDRILLDFVSLAMWSKNEYIQRLYRSLTAQTEKACIVCAIAGGTTLYCGSQEFPRRERTKQKRGKREDCLPTPLHGDPVCVTPASPPETKTKVVADKPPIESRRESPVKMIEFETSNSTLTPSTPPTNGNQTSAGMIDLAAANSPPTNPLALPTDDDKKSEQEQQEETSEVDSWCPKCDCVVS